VILQLAWMEWRRLMRTPLAWVMLAVALCLLSWQFLGTLEAFVGMPAETRTLGLSHHLGLQLFGLAAVLLLIVTPILTMRSFSELFRSGAYSLYSSAPVSASALLLGKYLGLLLYLLLFVALPGVLSLLLLAGSPIDLGLIAAASLGLLLLAALFLAIGLYTSVLSENPGVAAASAYGLLLLVTLLDQHTENSSFLHWLGWPSHYLNLQIGLVQTHDLAYFLILAAFFLGLALYRLDRRRSG
jgi:ABC-2 type transport system permease protein